jgi:hypothetical protein
MGPRAPINKTTKEWNGWPGTKELSRRMGHPKVAHGSPKGGWKLKATRMENVRGNRMREE